MTSKRRRLILKTAAATTACLAVLGGVAALAVLKAGWYNVGATRQHFQPVHRLLEEGMVHSVDRHSRDVSVPVLTAPETIRRGGALFRAHCAVCHGAPGVSQAAFGKSMQPVPGPLMDAARRWKPRELYWITRHGIRMSGMPAWEFHLADDDLWAVVAFLAELPKLTPQAYAALDAEPKAPSPSPAPAQPAARRVADPERGRVALTQYACHACHIIPGVTGSKVYVGPPLEGIANRKFIAGRLANTSANLALWLRDPQQVEPRTAMPALGVSEADAADMAAYLLTLN